MTRRELFLGTASLVLVPAVASAMQDYSPGLVDTHLANGDTVLVDFAADWCSTCRRQERIIQTLRAENPAYDQALTFVRVDWDRYGRASLATRLRVPRRSTLVLLRGNQELGRVVASTRVGDIQTLLDRGLAYRLKLALRHHSEVVERPKRADADLAIGRTACLMVGAEDAQNQRSLRTVDDEFDTQDLFEERRLPA